MHPFIPIQVVLMSAQAELALGFGQQPAQFKARIALQFLLLGAKAKAVMEGRSYATAEDIRAIAHPVLRHRIITTFKAESDGITSDVVVDKLLDEIAERHDDDKIAPALAGAFNAA